MNVARFPMTRWRSTTASAERPPLLNFTFHRLNGSANFELKANLALRLVSVCIDLGSLETNKEIVAALACEVWGTN